jgi:NADPH:quinone reductase-like Zn-dependent oxidoreductase
VPTDERSGLELHSTITASGRLELALERVTVREPADDEIVIRIDAAPINPSDLGIVFGPADFATMVLGERNGEPTLTAAVPHDRLAGFAARLDVPIVAGNEGAGVVVRAGSAVSSLLGRTVAARGQMYAQYRVINAAECVVFPDGTAPKAAASAFVNPLTVLAMLETMRREGHTALVHTAAASNVGQMLVRACAADGVPLVNIVRSDDQVHLLHDLGAKYVVNSKAQDFDAQLVDALDATGATLAFDAIGGGTMAETILGAMEAAALRHMTTYSRYGSPTHKQVYIYGGLDRGVTTLSRSYGMAYGVGGWLVMSALAKFGAETARRLNERVAAEITTTFASSYSAEISLQDALSPDVINVYRKSATGEKYLITPNAG